MFSAATKSARGTGAAANYIEDVFSTYLYTGTGATQTITNGIDLAGKGGLVWSKARNNADSHSLIDTVRGTNSQITSNNTDAALIGYGGITSFNSNGYTMNGSFSRWNQAGINFCNWTFREQPKFFDVVTYTGTGTVQNISHNLGSVPAFIITKVSSASGSWWCYHTSLGNATSIRLNSTAASNADATIWNSTTPTSTQFTVGASASSNNSGATYVAYLFAHNAGGFGTAGTDNVISCGSVSPTGSGMSVNLGFEPQFLLLKQSNGADGWYMVDNMRGFGATAANHLVANTSSAESAGSINLNANATGFTWVDITYGNWIYMAIRRPMKVPTTGTEAFAMSTWTGSTGNKDMGTQTNGFSNGYMSILKQTSSTQSWGLFSQLTGSTPFLQPARTDAEYLDTSGISVVNNRLQLNSGSFFGAGGDGAGQPYIGHHFKRAAGFMDEVCYTGTGSGGSQAHNLSVVPELMIVKRRDTTGDWYVYSVTAGNTNAAFINYNFAFSTNTNVWNSTSPTSSMFTVGTTAGVNASGGTFVAYLFATCAGVSKVGSYTGNGTAQAIACGFTGGARFVLIKRTDSAGDWYLYDTARGMTTLTDPYLRLNSTAAESATSGSVTTTAGGFTVNAAVLAAINTNAASYIFLAIA